MLRVWKLAFITIYCSQALRLWVSLKQLDYITFQAPVIIKASFLIRRLIRAMFRLVEYAALLCRTSTYAGAWSSLLILVYTSGMIKSQIIQLLAELIRHRTRL